MPQSDFARLLEAMRDQANWSQTELAEHLGVSNSTVSDWEGDRQRPRETTMDRVAERLTGVLPCRPGGIPLEPTKERNHITKTDLSRRFMWGVGVGCLVTSTAAILTELAIPGGLL